jgi:hypothetical protein
MRTVTALITALLLLQCASTPNRGNSSTDLPAFAKEYKSLVKQVVDANNLYYFNRIAFEVKMEDCNERRDCVSAAFIKWQQEYMRLVPMLKAAKRAKRIMVDNCTNPDNLKVCSIMASFNHSVGDIEGTTTANLKQGSHYISYVKLVLNEAGNRNL